jgi:hypothetical protein
MIQILLYRDDLMIILTWFVVIVSTVEEQARLCFATDNGGYVAVREYYCRSVLLGLMGAF